MSPRPRLRSAWISLALLWVLVGPALLPLAASGAAATGPHLLTAEELDGLREQWGTREAGRDYNIVLDGQGTGLAPPSEAGYEQMLGRLTVGAPEPRMMAPASVDLSADPWFPAVGNQGSQGSCAAWAMAYYCYGYQEARDNGWTDARTNPAHQISPAWAYNMVSGGADRGSWMLDIGMVLSDWGAATMATMPYQVDDFTTWGGEAAFREAPLHRAAEPVTLPYEGDATIAQLKGLLASGVPVTFTLASSNIRSFGGDYIISSVEYATYAPDHAQTLVGYDDALSEDGELGAFKVVNSWGTSSGDGGFYWLTYDAIKEIGARDQLNLAYVTDRPSYEPSLVAVWHFDPAPAQDAVITAGAGDSSSPLETKRPFYERGLLASTVSMPAFLVLDLSEMSEHLGTGERSFFVTAGGSGALSSLRFERYAAYVPGRPTQVSDVSPGTPAALPATASSLLVLYEEDPLDEAVDCPGMRLSTGGPAGWTAVDFERTLGRTSAQSGDVASGGSWMSAILIGPGELRFGWKVEAGASADRLTLRVNGVEVRSITGTTGWLSESVAIPEGVQEVTWTYLRSGNGGGSGYVDRVLWGDRSLRADSDAELATLARSMGWTGSGTAADPLVASGLPLLLNAPGDGLYLGNTTLHFRLLDSAVEGAEGGAGVHLYNATNVRVEGCELSANEVGLLIERSSNIVVEGNTFGGNGVAVAVTSSSAVIAANVVRDNGLGLDLTGMEGEVRDNLFERTAGLAVRAASPLLTVHRNAFLHNNGNSAQAADLSGGAWHLDGQGNHWSDWTSDADGDGLADLPYDLGAAADPSPFAAVASPPSADLRTTAEGAVELTWSEPSFLSGREVLRYEVETVTPVGTSVRETDARTFTDPAPVGGRAYTYRVRALVDVGEGSWSAPRSVTLPDLTAPALTILSPAPGSWVGRSSVIVSWSGQDEGTGLDRYEFRVDGGSWTAVGLATERSLSGLVGGAHTVAVRAYDREGNMAERSSSFSVDLVAPVVDILSPSPGGVVGASTVDIAIAVSDQGSGQQTSIVRVDGVLMGTFTEAAIVLQADLGDGAHTVTVTCRDAAGNSVTRSAEFVVDTVAPSLRIVTPAEGTVGSGEINVTCAFSDLIGPVRAEVRIDGGVWHDITAAAFHVFTGLADGPHLIEARAWDGSGRTVESSVQVVIDTGAPSVSLEQTPDGALRLSFTEEVDHNLTGLVASFPFSSHWDGDVLVVVPVDPLERGVPYELRVRSAEGAERPFSQTITFIVGNAGWVTGTVLDPGGSPLGGVFVVFDDGTAVLTAADGSFIALVHEGDRTFTVERGGTSYGPFAIEVVPGETVQWGARRIADRAPAAEPLYLAAAAIGTVAVLTAALVMRRRRA